MTIVLNGTTGITNDGGYTGDGISFADTTPANTLVTTTGGNVGIGTSSPDVFSRGYTRLLGISSSGSTAICINGASGNNARLDLGVNGTRVGEVYGESTSFSISSIGALPILFSTNSSERMRIDSSGNLLVNTTSQFGNGVLNINTYRGGAVTGLMTQPSTNSNYDAAGFRNSSGSYVGYISCTASATSYVTSSDYRLKENIAPMTGALAKVAQLKPCTYTWKADGKNGQGFIAHELAEVVPDCVSGEKDQTFEDGSIKPQGIDTSFLVATLTAAIQEQQAIITDLKSRIETLEAK